MPPLSPTLFSLPSPLLSLSSSPPHLIPHFPHLSPLPILLLFLLSPPAKADQFGCPLVEVSAKTDQNVSEIFHTLIQECWDADGGPPKAKNHRRGCYLL